MHRNTTSKLALVIMIAILSTIISACGQSEPKIDVDAQRTGFAQTANVQATMTADAQPTATKTLVPEPTLTSTPEVTPTSDVTTTPTEEEASAATATLGTVDGVDSARWLSNVPADKTDFNPGDAFTVTWTLENIGTTTWTTNYYIQFGMSRSASISPPQKRSGRKKAPGNCSMMKRMLSTIFTSSSMSSNPVKLKRQPKPRQNPPQQP